MTYPNLRRSALYLPASNQKAIDKARILPVDIVILDLEDAVAPEAKELAREQVVAALAAGGFGQRELIVRVNAPSTAWGEEDIAALTVARPCAILLPKVSSAQEIVASAERFGSGVRLWAMIETPLAVLRLAEIAAAPALDGLIMGTNDLAKEMMAKPGPDRRPLQPFLASAVAAARANGLAALDGVFNDLEDTEGFAMECAQGVEFGFDGKTLIHPSQIMPCNILFSPNEADIAWASAVIEAFALPENDGKGAIRVRGKMTERLHLVQARRILLRASP